MHSQSAFSSSIEPLESRIAPAAVFTFTDVDGDRVTVKTSKGTNDQLAAVITPYLVSSGLLGGKELQRISLTSNPSVFAGTDLTVTAVPQVLAPGESKSGDGSVDIGFIDSSNINLGAVKIAGNLGEINAGTASGLVPAVKSLSLRTLGPNGSIADTPPLQSTVDGSIGSIGIAANMVNAILDTQAGGNIGSISIGGSMLSGGFHVAGNLGAVTIGGNVEGGGVITGNGLVKSITIRGSVISGSLSGVGAIGQVKIGGDLTGSVHSDTSVQSVTIGGSGVSAGVTAAGAIGQVKVGGDWSGSVVSANSTLGSIFIRGSYRLSGIAADGEIEAHGNIGSITIGGDLDGVSTVSGVVVGARIFTDSGFGGNIGKVTIGRSILGGSGDNSGSIVSDGGIGTVKVGGDIRGGVGHSSAIVAAVNAIGTITVGGSLVGGNDTNVHDGIAEGFASARLAAASLGTVKIGGSIVGGNAPNTAEVVATAGGITSITVAGSVLGGPTTGEQAPSHTGIINAATNIGVATIGHDLVGSDQFGSSATTETGQILAEHIGSVTVGGSIIAGHGNASLTNSGTILAGQDIGKLTVKGSLVGNATHTVQIYARGQANNPINNDIAIKSINIAGRVDHVWIFAGVDTGGAAANGDAQIGTVSVGGDWIASSMEAGCTSTDGFLGDTNDAAFNGGTMSKIASVVIKGRVLGETGTNNTFGILSRTIGSFKYDGITVLLKAGAANDTFALGAEHALGASLSSTPPDGFAVHVFEVS